jgi:hypothetical protein
VALGARQVMQARFALEWMTGKIDALPLWNTASGWRAPAKPVGMSAAFTALPQREPGHAVELATQAISLAGSPKSSRYLRYIRDLCTDLDEISAALQGALDRSRGSGASAGASAGTTRRARNRRFVRSVRCAAPDGHGRSGGRWMPG